MFAFETIVLQPAHANLFYFFFQAEAGIRDGHVTGVQTCALPISWLATSPSASQAAASPHRWYGVEPVQRRSEERRVGKECRFRGARLFLKSTIERQVDLQ